MIVRDIYLYIWQFYEAIGTYIGNYNVQWKEMLIFYITENRIRVLQTGDCTVKEISAAVQAISWFFKDFINTFVINIMFFPLLRWKLNFLASYSTIKKETGRYAKFQE